MRTTAVAMSEMGAAAGVAGASLREFGTAYSGSPVLSLDDVRGALSDTIRAELGLADVTWQSQLPQSSRIMLNGAARLAERLGVVIDYDTVTR